MAAITALQRDCGHRAPRADPQSVVNGQAAVPTGGHQRGLFHGHGHAKRCLPQCRIRRQKLAPRAGMQADGARVTAGTARTNAYRLGSGRELKMRPQV